MSNVKVSVIVPCFNQAKYLEEALESVLEQTFENWECIVVNDGSPDSTEEVVTKWIALDTRFKYLYQNNLGVSAARNLGISHAKGKYILTLDADDKIDSHYIEKALGEFKNNVNLKIVYCQARKFGDTDEVWKLPKFSLYNLASNNMIFCSAVYKKNDWVLVGGYDENMKSGFEDWEFWIALLKSGGKVMQLDYFGFFYRIKKTSRTKKINQPIRDELFKYMSIKHADFFVEQFGSFFTLRNKIAVMENRYKANLRSEKYVIDLFLYRFFKFTLFGKFKL